MTSTAAPPRTVHRVTEADAGRMRALRLEMLADSPLAFLETLAQALLEFETLSGQEIKDLLEKGAAPNRDENNFPNAGPSVSVPVTPVSDGVTVELPTVH